MQSNSKQITAEYIESYCDDCEGKGVFRVALDKKPIIHTNPKQWPHKCTRCNKEVYLTFPYPILRYKGEQFLLAKHARFEGNDYIK